MKSKDQHKIHKYDLYDFEEWCNAQPADKVQFYLNNPFVALQEAKRQCNVLLEETMMKCVAIDEAQAILVRTDNHDRIILRTMQRLSSNQMQALRQTLSLRLGVNSDRVAIVAGAHVEIKQARKTLGCTGDCEGCDLGGDCDGNQA